MASNGDIIPFNVTATGSTGSKSSSSTGWLRVNGSGQLANLQTSGVALSGSYVPIYVTLDMATLTTLDPGSYAGSIAIAATSAANGSATVAVNLVVSAGPPTLNASMPIFPASLIAGPVVSPVITIYGDNFFSTSVVTIQQGANPAHHADVGSAEPAGDAGDDQRGLPDAASGAPCTRFFGLCR